MFSWLQAARLDVRRWLKARKRARNVVYTWPRWEQMRAQQASKRRMASP